jgi:hypothetical protein
MSNKNFNEEYEDLEKEKKNKFYNKYKNIFSEFGPKCGFYCDKGWFNLIENLCEDINNELNKPKNNNLHIEVSQIKEKFGGLRFYYDCIDIEYNDYKDILNKIDQLISKSENFSFQICEQCGKSGKLINFNGWLKTCCSLCEENIRKNLSNR